MNEFAPEKIVELRNKNKMSQKKLASYMEISDRAISKWETGLSRPSGTHLVHLSKIFNVPVEYFFKTTSRQNSRKRYDGMETLRELYKVGRGPSSSHTIGPENACRVFKEKYPLADKFCVVLYGSLAKTGKGHGTDVVIKKTFAPVMCEVEFNFTKNDILHPNTMELIAYKNGQALGSDTVYSIGGGSIVFSGGGDFVPEIKYSLTSFSDIAEYCEENSIRLWQYAIQCEGEGFEEYMYGIWNSMKKSIKKGLSDEGVLPGGLDVHKKAKTLYNNQHIDETSETRENRIVCAYAFAVGEQNASGEKIVTAPTCGAAGVVPSVLYYQQEKNKFSDERIVHALMTAGLVGNLIKTNASISGAECGCQAEIGSACAMASAALAELFELSIDKIEYAAEIAIEHHLGLTCDPICGLVQIPCIERNAVAAMRAINAVNLASFLWNTRKISLDKVIQTMKETGLDMHTAYKETSEGGLAKIKID